MSTKLPSRLDVLDGARGVAALVIIVHHSYGKLCARSAIDLSTPWDLASLVSLLLWIPDRLNHEAVLFFFILSGFCVHYGSARQMTAGNSCPINPLPFYARRWIRIFFPLAAALIITVSFDALSENLMHQRSLSSGNSQGVHVLVGNGLLLMPFFVPPYGSNGPLWAIGYEVWYYLLYPLWLWLSRSAGGFIAFSISLLVAVLSVLFVHGKGFALYPVTSTWWCWCTGALLAEIYAGRYSSKRLDAIPLWTIFLGAGLVLTGLTLHSPKHSLISYTLWTPVIGMIIYKLAKSDTDQLGRRCKFYRSLRFIGSFSYSLYVIQMPVLVFGAALWLRYVGHLPQLPWLILPGIILIIALAWALSLVVEQPTERIRARMFSVR